MKQPNKFLLFITAKDKMLLLFLVLKQGLVDLLLGAVFGISERTSRNTHHGLLNFLYRHLQPKLTWDSFALHYEKHHKVLHTTVTWVVDGSEQPVTASGSMTLDTEFYSQKKGQHSISVLMIVDMTGRILYLSPSFPDSNTDLVIARKTASSWLHLMLGNG